MVVSVLSADRLCTRCGYNLINQPVVRESVYDMLIARCSECGTVAAIQEYPSVGRWANRFTAMAALVWAVLVLALVLGTAALAASAAFTTQDIPRWRMSRLIEDVHRVDDPAAFEVANRSDDVEGWFRAQSAADLRDRIRARAVKERLPNGGAPHLWLPVLFFAPAVAVAAGLSAVLLPHQGRRGLIGIGLLIALVAGGIAFTIDMAQREPISFGYHDAYYLLFGRRIALTTVVIMVVAAMAGLLAGRPVTRGLVRMGIPPRLRGPLAFLWLADDRPLPPGIARPRGPRPI